MLFNQKSTGHMVQVKDIVALINPNNPSVMGSYQEGEEQQDSMSIDKEDLIFLSGEALPRCWLDSHYRDEELHR